LTPLATTFDDLSSQLGGSGKAKACWECFRSGIDPVFVFEKGDESSPSFLGEREEDGGILMGWTRQQITEHLTGTAKRGTPLTLGHTTMQLLSDRTSPSLESSIAQLSKLTTAKDGTTKLLLKLRDGFEVEAVIIPWHDRQTSTLCVSSQVGCRQACTFCSTGRMGKLRDLTADEILIQLFWALKICRLSSTTSQNQKLFPIQNIVFMGMGEPADNVEAVNLAARIMVDRRQFQLPPSKVVISTVAPTPSSFIQLLGGGGNAESKYDATEFTLAWSLHSSRNDIRQRLVPTARYTVEELRDGLIDAIQSRTSRRFRNVMIEITLIDGINDSVDDARHLADFCRTIQQRVPGLKLVVNLIPWNDIDASAGPASAYRKPTMERVINYQRTVTQDKTNKILCYVRTTRGDEENAACGMLTTKSKEGKVA
jgi:23S rRNA (adenine2503-C2)-methyltransferase